MGRAATTLRARCGLIASVLLATSAAADPSAVGDLVERTWFEGLPIDQAAELSPADGELLASLLADPTSAPHHGNIVLALGACGCGPAFPALASFEAASGEAPADFHSRAARRAIPQAMGLLARSDPRALQWLEERARAPLPPPDAGERRRVYALVLYGLAQSGASGAGTLLTNIEAHATQAGDPAAVRWAAQARRRWLDGRGETR